MRKLRVVSRETAVRSWSRREILARGAGLASVLALPKLWLPAAWGATAPKTFNYYISTTGKDSNPGTLAQPWAITSFVQGSANSKLMPGKQIGLIAGNYSLANVPQSSNWSSSLVYIPCGTSSASTYVASCDTNGNYSPRLATLTWTGAGLVPGIIGTDGTSGNGYITIDGLVINGGPLTGNYPDLGHIMQFYAPSYGLFSSASADMYGIVVQNCEIYGISQTSSGQNLGGIAIVGCVGAIIQNNYIHDINVTSGGSAGSANHCGATLSIGSRGTQYLYNTIANCQNSNGFWAKEGDSSATVAYNYLYNVATGSYALAQQCSAIAGFDGDSGNPNGGPDNNFVFHHNVLDSNGRDMVPLNDPVYGDMNRTAYNNTVYTGSGHAGDFGCDFYCLTQNSSNGPGQTGTCLGFYNNIYVAAPNNGSGSAIYGGRLCLNPGSSAGGNASNGTNGSGWTTVNNNCYYASNGSYSGFWNLPKVSSGAVFYSSLAAWQSATQAIVSGTESASIASDPKFTGGTTSIVPGNGAAQFQLAAGSPCIGKGSGGGNMGAWDGTTTQIGCNFGPTSTSSTNPVPAAPTLKVS
jgi:hypothetical protein